MSCLDGLFSNLVGTNMSNIGIIGADLGLGAGIVTGDGLGLGIKVVYKCNIKKASSR